jgi:hypothetical protein
VRLALRTAASPVEAENRLAPEPADAVQAQEGAEFDVLQHAAFAAQIGVDPIAPVDSNPEMMQQLVQTGGC